MITKQSIRHFLKKHKLAPDDLSSEAGTGRWSLRRFLRDEKAGVTLKTAEKWEFAMYRMLDLERFDDTKKR